MVEYMHNNYVNDIDGSITRVSGDDTFFETCNYKPIELTEEWLLKFGFIPNKYKDEYTICPYGKNTYVLDKEYTDKGEWDFCYEEAYLVTIKYVHQLQNLYFALTGEELTDAE